MAAFQHAFHAIKTGLCDSAIVAGSHLLLSPTLSVQLDRLGVLSPNGMSKPFDDNGDGFVRSEAAIVMLLQKESVAKRMYAKVLGAGTNVDGNKKEGITFPSGRMQNKLMREMYAESGINPHDVVYMEAHGTGTKVGDPQEVNSITDMFCTNRPTPLLLGSVKSNMGHAEGAAGLCGLSKVIIAMETGIIPRNLNFETPNKDITGIFDGRVKVVSKNEQWTGGIVGINSIGFGGTNAHVILQSNPKRKMPMIKSCWPRVVGVSGRTEQAVKFFLEQVHKHRDDQEFLALIDQIHSKNIIGHTFRGYSLLKDEPIFEITEIPTENRPICFVFSGMGSQWAGMAKNLIKLDIFEKSIDRCAEALRPHGIDLKDIMVNSSQETFENVLYSSISITAMQIALTDILKTIGIEPDFIVGHSMGEIVCAYADGAITSDEAMLIAYNRSCAVLECNIAEGAMAAIGLSWEEARVKCPPEIDLACHNSIDSVTVAGPPEAVKKLVADLHADNIFAKIIHSSKTAFHSKYIANAEPLVKRKLEPIITSPKHRSSRWISTSIPELAWSTPLVQTCGSEYFINNLLNPVLFHEALMHVPKNSTVIEIAPSALLSSILRKTFGKSATVISLVKKDHDDNISFLTSALGKIYTAGCQPKFGNLYDSISFPVSRGTPMINSMIKWDHSIEWAVARFTPKENTGELSIDIDLSKDSDKYLADHIIDGSIIFPWMGYLVLVWQCFAKIKDVNFETMPVILEDIQFKENVRFTKNGAVKFHFTILKVTGKFELSEKGSVVVSGKISVKLDNDPSNLRKPMFNEDGIILTTQDIYKEMRLRNHDYRNIFCGILKCNVDRKTGQLRWKNNWITFLDSMYQFFILGSDSRQLYEPSHLQKIVIDPIDHLSIVKQLSEDEGVNIATFPHIKVVKSGGIEFTGLKLNIVPTKNRTQQFPKLERYEFVPLNNYKDLSKSSKKAKTDALTVLSQLVLENSAGSHVKITEICQNGLDTALIPEITDIFNNEAMITVDAAIVVNHDPEDATYNYFKEMGINVHVKDFQTNAIIGTNVHLVILRNTIANNQMSLIKNAKKSLREGGFILLEEPKAIFVNLNTTNQISQIKELKLNTISIQSTTENTFILLRPEIVIPSNSILIQINENNFSWIDSLKDAMQKADELNTKVYIYAQGEPLTGLIGMVNCLKQEPVGGKNIRSVFIHDKNTPTFSLKAYQEQLKYDLVHNVLKNEIWGTYRHLLLEEPIDTKISPVKHAYIDLSICGDLSTLKWVQGPSPHSISGKQLCYVYYAAVNLADVMLATGKISMHNMSPELIDCHGQFGFEFSGKTSSGCRVMGLLPVGALSTTVLADRDILWDIPDSWSLDEAATIPLAYSTSYYALIIRGEMKAGKSILIHGGSGGIGLASIAISLRMGCEVYTTVSSQAKKEVLIKSFPQLNVNNIGYSRDTNFEQLVLDKTNGRGVDLVLNSSQVGHFQASLRCLAFGGRFLELARTSILENGVLPENATIHRINLQTIFNNADEKKKVVKLISEGIVSGVVQPLPKLIFNKNQIEQAFKFLASGKHIGKVVLKIRNEESENVQMPISKNIFAIARSYFDPNKSYILVGGLGGFGLELTDWLLKRGAKKLIIVSSSGIKTAYQCWCIKKWQKIGTQILVNTQNAHTKQGAISILEQANKLAPIGGIFNMATVICDAEFINQTEDNFKATYKPKADVTRQLDSAARTLAPQLDYFVCFSSFSCGRGNPGQSNYAAANSAMERIIEARKNAGFCGLIIQWASLGDVGLVFDAMGGSNDTEVLGTLPQRMSSCMATMDMLLQQPYPIVASTVIAKKRKLSNLNQDNLPSIIANMLSIQNLASIAPKATLEDLGVDSLMVAEIKQILQTTFDVVLTASEIKSVTFAKLQNLSAISCQ
ncbi:unnamed protein product [Ceutorhynchus assimilis]|uniref:Fatty acid synthase n=1 Tax=Ceutorhynchus assimilis TaxID=467358 RepID=A0A9N9N1F9_9CUCU|nr:unnamed protein product [Ceutorhynchus assimilis]